jgi:RNA polymerase sigma factor (sigma-70 family)
MGGTAALEQHRPLAMKVASAYYLPGHERQDVEQEAMIALWVAITTYDPDKMTFRAWARFVINRHLITCVKTARREKHEALTRSAREISDGNGNVEPIADHIPYHRHVDEQAELREELRGLLRRINTDLTPRQRYCILGISSGLTYDQMGGRRPVDNVLYRARVKLRTPR